MLTVLVADEDLKANSNCCRFLANDENLNIISASSGTSTLDKYYENHPDILVINSDFKDKSYDEIINELSSTRAERQNCNIILTVENDTIKPELDFMAKVYKLLYFPLSHSKIQRGIEQYNLDNIIFCEPNDENLQALFYKLNLFNESLGVKYLKSAIKKCYKNPILLNSLNTIFEITAKEFNVSIDSIRPAMRNTLNIVNDYRYRNQNKKVFKIFENVDTITPKNFIKTITINYLRQKRRNTL